MESIGIADYIPAVGDIRTLSGFESVELVWPETLQTPRIVMRGSHIWNGEAWLRLLNPNQKKD